MGMKPLSLAYPLLIFSKKSSLFEIERYVWDWTTMRQNRPKSTDRAEVTIIQSLQKSALTGVCIYSAKGPINLRPRGLLVHFHNHRLKKKNRFIENNIIIIIRISRNAFRHFTSIILTRKILIYPLRNRIWMVRKRILTKLPIIYYNNRQRISRSP